MVSIAHLCPNFVRVDLKDVDIYFSYKTVIAYRKNGYIIARENDWGTTTGKHLNMISKNKKDRLPSEEFIKKYNEEVGL